MQIHHIGYLVKSMPKSMAQFEDLGYKLENGGARYDELRKVTIAFLINGGYRVELVEPAKDSDIYPLLKKFKNSPYHICYEVDELQGSIEAMTANRCVLVQPPQLAPCINDGRQRVAFLGTASAGLIELLEK